MFDSANLGKVRLSLVTRREVFEARKGKRKKGKIYHYAKYSVAKLL